MSSLPKVTVLMPVYNGEKYLREAIESVLHQTFTDFEFLIINDGSTDKSVEIIKSYSDHRIRLVENEKNLGLIATLNTGIDLAKGEYIARMDCDDLSLPQRLEKQVRFMEARPEVGVCGTWFRMIGSRSDLVKTPEADNDIRWLLTTNSAFAHPSVILRHSVLTNHALRYNPEFLCAEDFEFWTRIAAHCQLANIPEVLFLYRDHAGQVSTTSNAAQIATADRIRKAQLKNFGIFFSDKEFKLHSEVVVGMQGYQGSVANIEFLKAVERWLTKLSNANKSGVKTPSEYFENLLAERWFLACTSSSGLGLSVWQLFWHSTLSKMSKPSLSLRAKFWIKCLLRWHDT